MAASYTGGRFRKKGPPRFTERASLGRRCEDAALAHYLTLGYRLARRNFRWHRLEGDLLLFHPERRHYVLAEVRGRSRPWFGRGESLDGKKRRNLTRLAEGIVPWLGHPLLVELVEVSADGLRLSRYRVF